MRESTADAGRLAAESLWAILAPKPGYIAYSTGKSGTSSLLIRKPDRT
ncbi:MAG: hypothetical protein ABGZ53_11080 [Fuerstiella sp.]